MYKKHFDKQAHLCPEMQAWRKWQKWRMKLDDKSGPFENGDFGETFCKISPEGWRYRECGEYSNWMPVRAFLDISQQAANVKKQGKNNKNNLARDGNRCTLRCVGKCRARWSSTAGKWSHHSSSCSCTTVRAAPAWRCRTWPPSWPTANLNVKKET